MFIVLLSYINIGNKNIQHKLGVVFDTGIAHRLVSGIVLSYGGIAKQ
jgi:hypothetical protein